MLLKLMFSIVVMKPILLSMKKESHYNEYIQTTLYNKQVGLSIVKCYKMLEQNMNSLQMEHIFNGCIKKYAKCSIYG